MPFTKLTNVPVKESMTGNEKFIINDDGVTRQVNIPNYVKTIGGVTPDQNGNVEIELGESWPSDLPKPSEGGYGWSERTGKVFKRTLKPILVNADRDNCFSIFDIDLTKTFSLRTLGDSNGEIVSGLHFEYDPIEEYYEDRYSLVGIPDEWQMCVNYYSNTGNYGISGHMYQSGVYLWEEVDEEYNIGSEIPICDGYFGREQPIAENFIIGGKYRIYCDWFYDEIPYYEFIFDGNYDNIGVPMLTSPWSHMSGRMWFDYAEDDYGNPLTTISSNGSGDWSTVPVKIVRINHEKEIIHKIDEKYLPEAGSGLPEITAEDDGVILVADNGEWKKSYEVVPIYETSEFEWERTYIGYRAGFYTLLKGFLFEKSDSTYFEVEVDGVSYPVELTEVNVHNYYLGEMNEMKQYPLLDNYPFFIRFTNGEGWLYVLEPMSNLKLRMGAFHKIDPKYLPEGGLGYTEYADFYETTDFHFMEDYDAPYFCYYSHLNDFPTYLLPESTYFEVELDGEIYHLELKRTPNNWCYYLGEINNYCYPLFDNYPFCINIFDGGDAQLQSSGETYHHLKLRASVIHKIDPKYYDAGVKQINEDWNMTADDLAHLETGVYQLMGDVEINGYMEDEPFSRPIFEGSIINVVNRPEDGWGGVTVLNSTSLYVGWDDDGAGNRVWDWIESPFDELFNALGAFEIHIDAEDWENLRTDPNYGLIVWKAFQSGQSIHICRGTKPYIVYDVVSQVKLTHTCGRGILLLWYIEDTAYYKEEGAAEGGLVPYMTNIGLSINLSDI